jgi:hypothetical protein
MASWELKNQNLGESPYVAFKGSNIYNNGWAFFIFGVVGGFSYGQKTKL